MSKKQGDPTLEDVLAVVPAEHRESLAAMAEQMDPAERAVLEAAIPPLAKAIHERDYDAFEAGLQEVGYGHFAFILWTILDPTAEAAE